jgi:hypothetical protein
VDAYVQAVLDMAPLAFWRMDEIEGWTAEDASGHQHTGRFEPGVAYHLPGRGPGGSRPRRTDAHRAVHFRGRTDDADSGRLPERWSLALWLWNGLPVDAREVTGYDRGRGQRARRIAVGQSSVVDRRGAAAS